MDHARRQRGSGSSRRLGGQRSFMSDSETDVVVGGDVVAGGGVASKRVGVVRRGFSDTKNFELSKRMRSAEGVGLGVLQRQVTTPTLSERLKQLAMPRGHKEGKQKEGKKEQPAPRGRTPKPHPRPLRSHPNGTTSGGNATGGDKRKGSAEARNNRQGKSGGEASGEKGASAQQQPNQGVGGNGELVVVVEEEEGKGEGEGRKGEAGEREQRNRLAAQALQQPGNSSLSMVNIRKSVPAALSHSMSVPDVGPASHRLSLGSNLESIKQLFGGKTEEEQRRAFEIHALDSVCSEMMPGVFLGSATVAQDLKKLRAFGVTHVVNTALDVCENYHEHEGVVYLALRLRDGMKEDISCCFYDVHDFLAAHSKDGEGVLVHCWQGVSRSGTLIVMHRMLVAGEGLEQALAWVVSKRSVVRPNPAFYAQLVQWDDRLRNGPRENILYRVEPQHSSDPHFLVARRVHKFTRSDLPPKSCCVLHTPTRVFLWVGRSCGQRELAVGERHVERLQRFEHAPEACARVPEGDKDEHAFWDCFP